MTTSRRRFLGTALLPAAIPRFAKGESRAALDPRGRLHIPIGIPDTVDTLKTFVEAEGNFSPGFGTYGIYFWLFDIDSGRLIAPTMDGVEVSHGLAAGTLLIPWSEWGAGEMNVRTEVCQVQLDSPAGPVFVAAVRARVANRGRSARRVALYATLRPLGAAGGALSRLEVAASGDTLVVDGHTALATNRMPSAAGVIDNDTIGELASAGKLPAGKQAGSESGDCSGGLRLDWTIAAGAFETMGFVCPVLPGRSAARHIWVDLKQNAMVDRAELNPKEGGIPQPDPGPAFYRELRPDACFQIAESYWTRFLSRVDVHTPDTRWDEAMRAILAHASLCMNEGVPDVAVVNYNVFNRDGMYIANIMQKSGLTEYSERVIDYFISHPFNGRAYPEADNPGQILWVIHQHWLLTRDRGWAERIYPSVRKAAAMIHYYRTTPGPHWVSLTSLEFGDALPATSREELKPGRCDGFHPEYTDAFDIAGLRGAAELAHACGHADDAASYSRIADALFSAYDEKFGDRLAKQYGSYAVLWPCRLYPAWSGKAHDQFGDKGAQKPESWRYFPLATAHQGLYAGNRAAGHGTLDLHLSHEQMRGWYAFDEGGGSGSGGWYRARTTWTHSKERPGDNRSVAMPHGWAIAELWLLMRDSIVFEDDEGRLVLFAGLPERWFRDPKGVEVNRLATYFGALDLSYKPDGSGAELSIAGSAAPPAGYVLSIPPELGATVTHDGRNVPVDSKGDCRLAPDVRRIRIRFAERRSG